MELTVGLDCTPITRPSPWGLITTSLAAQGSEMRERAAGEGQGEHVWGWVQVRSQEEEKNARSPGPPLGFTKLNHLGVCPMKKQKSWIWLSIPEVYLLVSLMKSKQGLRETT